MSALALTSVHPSIVCLGDSQTQFAWSSPHGFVAGLANAYQRKADVVNRGFSGYTTRDVVRIVRWIFTRQSIGSGKTHAPKGQPDSVTKRLGPSTLKEPPQQGITAVILWLGCNDSIDPGQSQYVPEDEYAANLNEILDVVTGADAEGAAPAEPEAAPFVLVVSPTPVLNRANHSNARKETYTEVARGVAKERSVKHDRIDFLDAYRLFLDEAEDDQHLAELLDADGLHISPTGYQLLFDAISGKLEGQRGAFGASLTPEKMPSIFPPWDDPSLKGPAKP